MPKHCPTCNKSSAEISFYGEFCYDCASKKLMEGLSNEVEVIRCKRCERIKAPTGFANLDKKSLEQIIAKKFSKFAVHLVQYDNEKANIDIAETTDKGILATDKIVTLDFKKVLCDKCFKKASNYHEAVVQLRGNSGSVERMMGRITRYIEQGGEFVSKVEDAPNGVNMYISNKNLTAEFMTHAKLHPVKSFTLMGLKNGRRVYKNTFALHF